MLEDPGFFLLLVLKFCLLLNQQSGMNYIVLFVIYIGICADRRIDYVV